MRRIPASFLRATEASRSQPTGARPLGKTRRLRTRAAFAAALVALGGAVFPAVSAAATQATATQATATQPPATATQPPATATQPPASIVDATTGLPDAANIAPVAACPPPTPVRATCLAQILRVRGTGALVHPRLRKPASIYRFARPRAGAGRPATAVPAAAGAPQPGTPAYLQQAYDLAYLSQTAGPGQTIAIVDAFDDPNAEADLATYRAEFGLPACTTANGCFAKYDQNGGTNYPTTVNSDWENEISLDLDAVSALCPNCRIVLVEANSDSPSDLATAQFAASQAGATVISDSWDLTPTNRQAYSALSSSNYTFPGITTVAASGDKGYLGPSTNDFPAALPGVTAAGGTTLEPAASTGIQSIRGFTESAWSGAGSGCNQWANKPDYQTDIGCMGRSYADISADADPLTGMQVYDSADGGWQVVGGTSMASPLIAAYYALVGAAAQGPHWAYLNSGLLNDPSSGSNGLCPSSIFYICNARPGYDGPTGVGSISGAVVGGAPGIAGPGANGSYAQTVTTASAQLQGGVYPNGADTTYWWQYGTTTAYGQQTPATDVGSGTGPMSVTDSLSGLSGGQTYHYRLVAQNSVGTVYGYDYTFATPSTTSSLNPGGGPNPPTTTPSPPTTTTPGSPPVAPSPGSSLSTGASLLSAPALSNIRVGAGATSATVSATIATGGAATRYALQVGSTPSLGTNLSRSKSSPAPANVSWTLRNLSPGRVYYFRVVASNARGTTGSAVVRFRTSAVTITRITTNGNVLDVVLRCHGSAPCHVTLQGRSGARLLLSSRETIRGNRTGTITLRISKSFRTLATNADSAKLFVLSTWNGSTATVSATV